jgi:hypothetical protein
MAGVDLLRGNMQRMKQTPLTPPKRPAQPLSEETAAVAKPAASPQSPEPVGNAAAPKVEE